MENLNDYLTKYFDKLPLSHQNFIPASVDVKQKGAQISGTKNNQKYRLLYLDFYTFYKPITSNLK
jgi:hypothetical protein